MNTSELAKYTGDWYTSWRNDADVLQCITSSTVCVVMSQTQRRECLINIVLLEYQTQTGNFDTFTHSMAAFDWQGMTSYW